MDTELRASTAVDADPAAVFGYFTDPVLLTRWLATTARIDRTDAGQVLHADADGRHITALALDRGGPCGLLAGRGRAALPRCRRGSLARRALDGAAAPAEEGEHPCRCAAGISGRAD